MYLLIITLFLLFVLSHFLQLSLLLLEIRLPQNPAKLVCKGLLMVFPMRYKTPIYVFTYYYIIFTFCTFSFFAIIMIIIIVLLSLSFLILLLVLILLLALLFFMFNIIYCYWVGLYVLIWEKVLFLYNYMQFCFSCE